MWDGGGDLGGLGIEFRQEQGKGPRKLNGEHANHELLLTLGQPFNKQLGRTLNWSGSNNDLFWENQPRLRR